MNGNQQYLNSMSERINRILEAYNVTAEDIPDDLLCNAVLYNAPEIVKKYIENRFVVHPIILDILETHSVSYEDVPADLVAASIRYNSPEIVRNYIEDGFVIHPIIRDCGWLN